MSTAYLLGLALSVLSDMATGAGPRRALRPRRPPLLSLAAAPRRLTPLDSVWPQADGWAGQQEQTGHHTESLEQGWKAGRPNLHSVSNAETWWWL